MNFTNSNASAALGNDQKKGIGSKSIGKFLSKWWNKTRRSVYMSFRSSKALESEYKAGIDPRSFTYCWDFNHFDVEHYIVIEVEDLTLPMQLDDASLFRESLSLESEGLSNSYFFLNMGII